MASDSFVRSLLQRLPQLAHYEMWRKTPQDARADFRKLMQFASPNVSVVGKVENLVASVAGRNIPLRLYTPMTAPAAPCPAIVFMHGGGFVLGDLDSYDPLCRALTNGSGCRLISVDYRLAPEHPFPAGVDDCYDAVSWVAKNAAPLGIDPARIAVVGDSAGGNLAAVTCLLARDRGGPHIAFQALIYPTTSLAASRSKTEFAAALLLNQPTMDWFFGHYLPKGTDMHDMRVSPLSAKDHSNLPPAYVVTAGLDPLRDEGIAYAHALEDSGVKTQLVDYPAMIHGFFGLPGLIPLADNAVATAGAALRAGLG